MTSQAMSVHGIHILYPIGGIQYTDAVSRNDSIDVLFTTETLTMKPMRGDA